MRRQSSVFATLVASSALALSLTTSTARAVPLVVDFRFNDASGTIEDAFHQNDAELFVPKAKGKGNGKGGSDKPNTNDIKDLKLWLSKDGKNWVLTDAEVLAVQGQELSARWKAKGNASPIDITGEYDLRIDSSGLLLGTNYLGLSTSGTSWSGGFSARLISMEFSATHTPTTLPVSTPATLMLVMGGAFGAAFARRRKR